MYEIDQCISTSHRNEGVLLQSAMAEEIPVFPKASTLLINTGNIVNWNRLKRKPNQTPTEEVIWLNIRLYYNLQNRVLPSIRGLFTFPTLHRKI